MATTSRRDRDLLTPKQVEHAPKGRIKDGCGLFLQHDDHGKRWLFRKYWQGRQREYGLGGYPAVSLAQARVKRDHYEELIQTGRDPLEEKRQATIEADRGRCVEPIPTFKQAAERCFAERQSTFSNRKHVYQWLASLEQHAYRYIGDLPVNQVGKQDVLAVLKPIWTTLHETATRVQQRMETVLDWAAMHDYRSDENPVRLVKRGKVLPVIKKSRTVKHHAALPHAEMYQFIEDLKTKGKVADVTRLAFQFLIYTVARTTEVRDAKWEEIDMQRKVWTVPGERMKARTEHVVTLSSKAIGVLEAMRQMPNYTGGGRIFKDPKTGAMLSENRFTNARDSIGYGDRMTPHGVRSSFKDWSAETTTFNRDAVEVCLAHTVGDKVMQAYQRTTFLNMRFDIMEAWARYVNTPPAGMGDGSNVVSLKKAG